MKGGPVAIKLRRDVSPKQQYGTRPIPLNLQEAVNREIDEQVAAGIIEFADDTNDPSEWINPMVATRKKDPSKARITVDLRELNKATIRPIYPSQSPIHTVCHLPKTAAYFTVLDGLKGFHQIDLEEGSRKLTTFITPRGRMRYCRMPMGWHGSSDVFNERMAKALEGIPHIARIVEDILIYSTTWEEHIQDVKRVLQACDAHDISINPSKVQFGMKRVKFGGFIVKQGQYQIDPELTEDLRQFPVPENRTDLRSFMGLAQQLGGFSTDLTTILEPLRSLLSYKADWAWQPYHQQAFEEARIVLSNPPHLTYFDPRRQTQLLTDASRLHGLGFLLRQKCDEGTWRTVQCGSRTLAKHESNWSGMAELEALAVAWAAKKCAFFLDGLDHFEIITDSNPLVSILNNRRLDQIQNDRLLKLKTTLLRYNFTARWQAGKRHKIADALSRKPRNEPRTADQVLTQEEDADREFIIATAISQLDSAIPNPSLDAQQEHIQTIRRVGQQDPTYKALLRRIHHGWPDSKQQLLCEDELLAPYYKERESLYAQDDIILHGPRLLVPGPMRRQILHHLHAAHQGISKTLERARMTVWWPTIATDVTDVIRHCRPCQEHLPSQPHEPMQRGPDAERPFQKLHADLFEVADTHYLVLTDEFSGWPDITTLGTDTSSRRIIEALRNAFMNHARPVMLKPDNGRQFVSHEVQAFLKKWGVALETSSPHLPRSNGRAEAAVKAMKKIIRGATPEGAKRPDPDELTAGIMAFRNTPRYGGRSPAELIYGRTCGEMLPRHPNAYDPKWERSFRQLDETAAERREKLEAHYEATAKPLQPFPVGTPVMVQHHQTKRWTISGTVTEVLPKHEYLIQQDNGGILRRNRTLLRKRYFRAPPQPQLQEEGPSREPRRTEAIPTAEPSPAEVPQTHRPEPDQSRTPPTPPNQPAIDTRRTTMRTAKPNPRYTGEEWTT
uniref:RNA-directed DNA polymerase n=1 Tax=Photinus pyralis TaxID=7054 RepID=A0A1Y1MUA0_PHOPY